MTQKLLKTETSARKAKNEQLFRGIWIRWRALTRAERFVCVNIVLLPVWWVVGLTHYMPLLLLLSVVFYQWRRYGGLHLKQPSLAVIALFAFGSYQFVRIWLVLEQLVAADIPGRLFTVVTWWLCPACWLWYIQSKNIKLRLEVVAWAFTVSAVQCIGFWFLFQFILPETLFFPPQLRNLFAVLTHRVGESYYLTPFGVSEYSITGVGIGGLFRFQFFTRHPLHFAIVAGVMGLVALDLKNRLWSRLLLLVCCFLIFVSGSRTVWVLFPVLAILRSLLANQNNHRFIQSLCALIAIASFTIFSLPPVTNLVWDQSFQSATAINEVRAESSENRFELYSKSLEGFQDNPVWGHFEDTGERVGQRAVGLESFVLGHLLYVNGLIGTAMFAVFWISFFNWLYRTREHRPTMCFLVFVFYTLISITLESVYRSEFSSMLLILCAATYCTHTKSVPKGIHYA